jgi:hypothetical protein
MMPLLFPELPCRILEHKILYQLINIDAELVCAGDRRNTKKKKDGFFVCLKFLNDRHLPSFNSEREICVDITRRLKEEKKTRKA